MVTIVGEIASDMYMLNQFNTCNLKTGYKLHALPFE